MFSLDLINIKPSCWNQLNQNKFKKDCDDLEVRYCCEDNLWNIG